jgi:hypothetical protein
MTFGLQTGRDSRADRAGRANKDYFHFGLPLVTGVVPLRPSMTETDEGS